MFHKNISAIELGSNYIKVAVAKARGHKITLGFLATIDYSPDDFSVVKNLVKGLQPTVVLGNGITSRTLEVIREDNDKNFGKMVNIEAKALGHLSGSKDELHQWSRIGVNKEGDRSKENVLLLTASSSEVTEKLKQLVKAKVKVKAVEHPLQSSYSLLSRIKNENLGVRIWADVGKNSTILSFLLGDTLVYTRSVASFGIKDVVGKVARDLRKTDEQAKELIKTYGLTHDHIDKGEDETGHDVYLSLTDSLNELQEVVYESYRYLIDKLKFNVDSIVLAGEMAEVPGASSYLHDRLSMEFDHFSSEGVELHFAGKFGKLVVLNDTDEHWINYIPVVGALVRQHVGETNNGLMPASFENTVWIRRWAVLGAVSAIAASSTVYSYNNQEKDMEMEIQVGQGSVSEIMALKSQINDLNGKISSLKGFNSEVKPVGTDIHGVMTFLQSDIPKDLWIGSIKVVTEEAPLDGKSNLIKEAMNKVSESKAGTAPAKATDLVTTDKTVVGTVSETLAEDNKAGNDSKTTAVDSSKDSTVQEKAINSTTDTSKVERFRIEGFSLSASSVGSFLESARRSGIWNSVELVSTTQHWLQGKEIYKYTIECR